MAKCKDGTYCDNNLGSFLCKGTDVYIISLSPPPFIIIKDCDSVCDGLCTGEGPGGCVSCKDGYKMEDGRCEGLFVCNAHQDSRNV